MSERRLDYSRYRTAEAIVERWKAGEAAGDIGGDFGLEGGYFVELLVAAYDRPGRYNRNGSWSEQRRKALQRGEDRPDAVTVTHVSTMADARFALRTPTEETNGGA